MIGQSGATFQSVLWQTAVHTLLWCLAWCKNIIRFYSPCVSLLKGVEFVCPHISVHNKQCACIQTDRQSGEDWLCMCTYLQTSKTATCSLITHMKGPIMIRRQNIINSFSCIAKMSIYLCILWVLIEFVICSLSPQTFSRVSEFLWNAATLFPKYVCRAHYVLSVFNEISVLFYLLKMSSLKT